MLLGANTIDYGNKTDTDIDALRTQGKYRIYAYQGTYWPVNTYGVLYVEVANNYTIQYFIKMAEGITYKRTMVTNAPTPTWSDWIMDYSTDILTRPTYLAPLASALGGLHPLGQATLNTDILSFGAGYLIVPRKTLGGVPAGIPVDADGILVIIPFNGRANDSAKIFLYVTPGARLYVGTIWWTSSISWKQVTETDV